MDQQAIPSPGDLPNKPRGLTLIAYLGMGGAAIVGMYNMPLPYIIPCGAAIFGGEALRLGLRPAGLQSSMFMSLIFSSVVFSFISYGLARLLGWIFRYFNMM